jgi:hypothetical protein
MRGTQCLKVYSLIFEKSQGKHNNLDYQFQKKVPLIAKFQ